MLALSIFFLALQMPNLVAQNSSDSKRSITLRELREAYLKVNGGRQNIDSLQSNRTAGRIVFTDESKDITFNTLRKRSGMIRHNMTYPNGVRRKFLVNKEGVWSKIVFPTGEERSEILSEQQIKSLKQSARMLSPFMQTDGRSDWVELKGLESLGTPEGEIMAYRLDVLPASGLPFSEIWLHEDNYQEVLVVARSTDAANNDVVRSTFYRKYDQIGGIQYPTELLLYEDDQKKQTVLIEEMKMNIGIFKSYFDQKYFIEETKSQESTEESTLVEEMSSNNGIFKSYSNQANFFDDTNPLKSP